jgi:DNA replication and repair protein RecF
MKVTKIEITNFRNLVNTFFQPDPGINIFYGENGSGKTSVLEAIYYLSIGRSFRSKAITNIITHTKDQFTIYSSLLGKDNDVIPVGIEKNMSGFNRLRLAGQDIASQAEILNILPIQLINPDGYLLLEAGPAFRRKYLDWGVFHVEQSFISHWRKMKHIIQQRNALLKARNIEQISLWNEKLSEVAALLHTMRENYINELRPLFLKLVELLLPTKQIEISYEPGWDVSQQLITVLNSTINKDLVFGYTGSGPHRADLKFNIDNRPVFEVLSRGQQKMLIFALLLAQGLLLYQQTNKRCLYLIDDLPSELDSIAIANIVQVLVTMDAQIFITAIMPDNLLVSLGEKYKAKLFHVEQGQVAGV